MKRGIASSAKESIALKAWLVIIDKLLGMLININKIALIPKLNAKGSPIKISRKNEMIKNKTLAKLYSSLLICINCIIDPNTLIIINNPPINKALIGQPKDICRAGVTCPTLI